MTDATTNGTGDEAAARNKVLERLTVEDGASAGSPTPEFWELWRAHKHQVKSLGFTVSREADGRWLVSIPGDPSSLDAELAAFAALDAQDMLPWNGGRVTTTARGVRRKRTAPASSAFLRLWDDPCTRPTLVDKGLGLDGARTRNPPVALWWCPVELDRDAINESRITRSDAHLLAPAGQAYMPFQKAGIGYALKRRATLLADEMGLGKTIQAIGVINNDPGVTRTLIVCPASVRPNWMNELRKWDATGARHVKLSTLEDCETLPEGRLIAVTTYSRLLDMSGTLAGGGFDCLVCDEAHLLKTPKAGRTTAVAALLDAREMRRLYLTGTPMLNRPQELFTLLKQLDPDTWSNRGQFLKRYCGACLKTVPGGRKVWQVGETATNANELAARLREGLMVRRLKSEVYRELPPKTRATIALDESDLAAGAMAAIEVPTNTLRELRDATHRAGEMSPSKVRFEEVARIYHDTGLAKAPLVARYVSDLARANPGHKMVVFAHHADVIDTLLTELRDGDIGHALITGDTLENKRGREVDRFQDDPACQVFVGNIEAAGVGITLTASEHVIFAELPWRPADVFQAEDRCHRIGQVGKVRVDYFTIAHPNSLDDLLTELLSRKQRHIDAIIDADVDELLGQLDETTASTEDARAYGEILETLRSMPPALPAPPESLVRPVTQCLGALASVCDGVVSDDGMGFSGTTRRAGISLLDKGITTASQLAMGVKICTIHKQQIEHLTGIRFWHTARAFEEWHDEALRATEHDTAADEHHDAEALGIGHG